MSDIKKEEILSKYLVKENGLNIVLEMILNTLMYCEREEHLSDNAKNKGKTFS